MRDPAFRAHDDALDVIARVDAEARSARTSARRGGACAVLCDLATYDYASLTAEQVGSLLHASVSPTSRPRRP
ncbi:hypothetical protein [Streptomyces sp. NPDC060194]|uniref:hypothetical protein n=1 Tax=Streptomyces sp. NPDC060194 TaxID=3347069 RepID=UPI0036484F7C